jgi:2-dehydro-3-deoxyphosphogluconate aldolase/(4S)-4-hydroxy-2-oxoglutarate aldolase
MFKNAALFIEESKIIAIIRNISKENAIKTVEAIYKGGIRCAEVALNQKNIEESLNVLSAVSERFYDKMLIGAGTVLTPSQVEAAKGAGARYIVSPDTDESVILKTRELGLISIPGTLTPTEIKRAHILGADFVKVFPIDSVNENYLKSILAPLSHIKMIAVGSVACSSIGKYLSHGVAAVGIGSALIDKKLISSGDFEGIEKLAKLCVSQV